MVEQATGVSQGARTTSRSLSVLQPVCCPPGCYLSRSQIEQIAEEWASRVVVRRDDDWLSDFILSMGGDVRPAADPATLLLVAERLDCFVVTVTDMWTMAEALGHLVLHIAHLEPPEGDTNGRPAILAVPAKLGAGGPLARARLEAVWFASAFLMPGELFRAAWNRQRQNLRAVAAELGMPMAMVAARAVRLRLA